MNAPHGWVTPLPDGAKARCMGPPGCAACVEEWHVKNTMLTEPCGCGRPMRYLNYVSPWPSCWGCGLPAEICSCQPL